MEDKDKRFAFASYYSTDKNLNAFKKAFKSLLYNNVEYKNLNIVKTIDCINKEKPLFKKVCTWLHDMLFKPTYNTMTTNSGIDKKLYTFKYDYGYKGEKTHIPVGPKRCIDLKIRLGILTMLDLEPSLSLINAPEPKSFMESIKKILSGYARYYFIRKSRKIFF